MDSLLDFSPAVKVRQSLRLYGWCNHRSRLAKPSSQDMNFIGAPSFVYPRLRYSMGYDRGVTTPAATESRKAAAELSTEDSKKSEAPKTTDQLTSSNSHANPNANSKSSSQASDPSPKRPPTAREKLRAARLLSRYTDTKPSKSVMGSKLLEALKEGDKGKKRSGLPEAPTNLFDDSNRGMPKQSWTFDFPGGRDLLLIGISFILISTIMLGTTYIVWKVGAIHFNEY